MEDEDRLVKSSRPSIPSGSKRRKRDGQENSGFLLLSCTWVHDQGSAGVPIEEIKIKCTRQEGCDARLAHHVRVFVCWLSRSGEGWYWSRVRSSWALWVIKFNPERILFAVKNSRVFMGRAWTYVVPFNIWAVRTWPK